jgi:hypothetical protein
VILGKYKNESKYHTNGREITGIKVSITLMVRIYRNESKYLTNGKEIHFHVILTFVAVFSLPLV